MLISLKSELYISICLAISKKSVLNEPRVNTISKDKNINAKRFFILFFKTALFLFVSLIF
ncbi:MAG TPA: hypothetical protein DHV91_02900 [Flavobacteriaceae bacterium]|nr:hypothetical protein [Flavobacteriaceae bacterium]